MLHEECHYLRHGDNMSKNEMLVNWYKWVALRRVDSLASRKEVFRRMDVLLNILNDTTLPEKTRVAALANYLDISSEVEAPKNLKKKVAKAARFVFNDNKVFELFQIYYGKFEDSSSPLTLEEHEVSFEG